MTSSDEASTGIGKLLVISIVTGIAAALAYVAVLKMLDIEVNSAVVGGVVGAVVSSVVSS